MRKIPLTKGHFAIVDDEDYEELSKYKWYSSLGRAVRGIPKGDNMAKIHMHRVIAQTPEGMDTDHINGDPLDNRRSNLRWATRSQNLSNKGMNRNNKSGFKGVFWFKNYKKWLATIRVDKKRIFLGYFKDKIEAAIAYNNAAIKYHNEFAKLNII